MVFVPATGNDPEHGFLALTLMLWALLCDFAIERFAELPQPGGTGMLARLRYRLARAAVYATAALALLLLMLILALTARALKILLGS